MSPYIFNTNAVPSTAALPLNEPCTNSGTRVLSFRKAFASAHVAKKHSDVTIMQYKIYLPSNSCLKSVFIKSCTKRHGNVTLKFILFATFINSGVIQPILFKTYPTTITKNTGTVALRLYIKLLIILSP